MNELGKFLVVAGLIVAGIGVLICAGVGKGWIGRLPGDIQYTKGNFTLYFPIVTCVVISIIITFLWWLFRR